MKKWIILIFLSLLLVSCKQEVVETNESTEAIKTANVVDEIAQQEIRSNTVKMKAQSQLHATELDFRTDITGDIRFTMEPKRFHALLTTVLNEKTDNQTVVESYADENSFFYKTNLNETWVKGNDTQIVDVDMLIKNYTMTGFKAFYDQFKHLMKLSETEDTYILRIEGSGMDYVDLIKTQVNNIQGMHFNPEELTITDIKDVRFEFVFSKRDYLPLSMLNHMNFSFYVEEAEMSVTLSAEATFSDVNRTDSFEIPEEIKDAKETTPVL